MATVQAVDALVSPAIPAIHALTEHQVPLAEVRAISEDLTVDSEYELHESVDIDAPTISISGSFVSFSDTLVDDFDCDVVLGRLTDVCCRLVTESEVSVMMVEENGSLRVATASSARKRTFEQAQVDRNCGPSIEARQSGQQTIQEIVNEDGRWSYLFELAQNAGYRIIQTIPLQLRNETIGVLSIAETIERPRPASEALLLRTLADCTTIGIVNQRVYSSSNDLVHRLQTALTTRVIVEQSKGVVVARLGVTIDQAFQMLRDFARSSNRKLIDVAGDIISGAIPIHDLWSKNTSVRSLRRN